MSDFDTDERSVSGSRPIDLYVIATPTQTFNLTSYVVDVTYAGVTYTATTMSRGPQQVAQDLTGREFLVYLPITHPLVQRYAAFGIPEHEVLVTQLRLQSTSGVALQGWSGFANALSVDGGGHVATLRVPSVTDDAFRVRLPTIGLQRLCFHRLGDANCTVDLVAAQGLTSVIAISDTTVQVAHGGTADFHVYGDIVHVATKQRRMVVDQNNTTPNSPVLTLSAPFVGVVVGDQMITFPGCDHSVQTCNSKYTNVINFGGHPDLNATINPWAPNGFGVIQQT